MKKNNEKKSRIIEVSEDIILKEITLEDTAELFSIVDSQRDYLEKWIPFVNYVVDMKDADHVVVTMMNVANFVQEYVFIIKYKNESVGLVGFRNYDEFNKKAELGYFISMPLQGRGIVLRSVAALMDFACDELAINKLLIKCPVGHLRSSNIPRKLGYRIEGIERAGELVKNDIPVDLEIYGMLRDEYLKMRDGE